MIFSFILFLAAVVTVLVLGWNLAWAILFGLGIFCVLGLRRGYCVKELAAMAWKKGKNALIVVPVFLLIGAVTALWRASGTTSFFLYYGLNGIPKNWFLLVAFLMSAVLSFALGTSHGVTGTAGVVLMTLARSGGVPVAATAGAVLSGAYFGDRCSPMSSCATLVAACTGTELYSNVREMLKTAALPTILTTVIFGVISVRNPIAAVDESVLSTLRDNFSLNALVVLPAVLMLALPLLKVPVKWAMAASAGTAFLLAIFLQHLPILTAMKTVIFGYVPVQSKLAQILSGGGMISMARSCIIVFVTSLYAGILEGIDVLAPLKTQVEHLVEKLGLFPAAVIVSTLVVGVFCNQSVMVIMDEQLLSQSYEKRGRSRLERAMDIANSGVTIAGLVPWSIALTVPLAMLDADLSAIPYAVLLYLIPLCYLLTKKWFAPAQNAAPTAERSHP